MKRSLFRISGFKILVSSVFFFFSKFLGVLKFCLLNVKSFSTCIFQFNTNLRLLLASEDLLRRVFNDNSVILFYYFSLKTYVNNGYSLEVSH